MADLLVIAYPTEAQAEQVRSRLLGMQKEYLIKLGDAVVAVKQPDGQVKLNQLFSPAGPIDAAVMPAPSPRRPRPIHRTRWCRRRGS